MADQSLEVLMIYKKIVEWIIPVLLLALCRYLASISSSLIGIRQEMAVLTVETRNVKKEVADLAERVSKLEDHVH